MAQIVLSISFLNLVVESHSFLKILFQLMFLFFVIVFCEWVLEIIEINETVIFVNSQTIISRFPRRDVHDLLKSYQPFRKQYLESQFSRRFPNSNTYLVHHCQSGTLYHLKCALLGCVLWYTAHYPPIFQVYGRQKFQHKIVPLKK